MKTTSHLRNSVDSENPNFSSLLSGLALCLFTATLFSISGRFTLTLIIMLGLFIVFPCWFLVCVIFQLKRKKMEVISMFILALGVFLGVTVGRLIYDMRIHHYEMNFQNKDTQNGNAIIVAVKAFEKDNGYFPEKLDLLVPKYLAVVPQTVKGRDFGYSADKSPGGCQTMYNKEGQIIDNSCDEGKWSFYMRFPSYDWNMCYKFNYETEKGYSEQDWHYCEIPF